MIGLGDLILAHLRSKLILYFFVIIIFLMGAVFGCFSVGVLTPEDRSATSNFLNSFFDNYSQARIGDKAELARQAVEDNVIKTAGLIWLLGVSVICSPLILVVVFVRGFVVGFTVGFMISEMVVKGVLLAFVSIVPHNIITFPAIIITAAAGLGFAVSAAKMLIRKRRGPEIYSQFAATCLTTAFAAVLLLAAAFVEAYITPVLVEVATRFIL